MATGPLRFRTSHITELPTTHIKQAPGFAWVAVPTGPGAAHDDPSKNWGTANRKRARHVGGLPAQLGDLAPGETVTAKQQEKIDRKLRELNSDAAWGRDLTVPSGGKKDGGGGGGGGRAGRTTGTKKILSSGKTFAHYLDDEEAEIARTGRRDIEMDAVSAAAAATTTTKQATPPPSRPIKMPRGKRKPGRPSAAARQQQQLQEQENRQSGSPAPSAISAAARAASQSRDTEMPDAGAADDFEGDEANPAPPPLPTDTEIAALLTATPLTYAQARSAPPPSTAPPARRFCEICGYWGRVRCMKCGVMTCSVACKDAHDEHRCLKFYA